MNWLTPLLEWSWNSGPARRWSGVGWVVFWIYWIAASVGVKAGRTRWARFAGVRVAIILAVLLLLRLRVLKGPHTVTGDPWLQGIGLAIFLLGLALAVWARIYIGRNWGMPMSEKARPGASDDWSI
jgi:protein-S-isoprenylcysteine O-methyltransferase Ste14